MNPLLKSLRVALLSVFALAVAPVARAQVTINVGPPSWGPAVPAGAQYYYIPEANSFYDVPARQYVVQRDGRWIRTATLAGYNTSSFHPVVVDYVGAQPWSRYDEYRGRYPRRNPSNGGLPPGQAKKMYRGGDQDGRYDDRRDDKRRDERYEDRGRDHRDDRREDDRRYERRDDDRRDQRREDNDRDGDHGKYKDKEHGKGKKDKD